MIECPNVSHLLGDDSTPTKSCRLRQDRSGSTWLGLQSCLAPSCHPGPQWKPRKEVEINPQNHACDMLELDYECLQTPKRWILICSKLILTSQQQFFLKNTHLNKLLRKTSRT